MNLKYKGINVQRDKVFLAVASVFISIYMAFSCTYFASAANTVKSDVVRLHILANSDSKEDQAIKLKVRDELLKKNTSLLSDSVNTENAHIYFNESKDELLKTTKQVLKENGFSYGAKITLEKEYFETRKYDSLTFPAGEYLSLKVVLGEGSGKNWWCVMFPPLCVPAADGIKEDKEKTADYLTPSGEKIINSGEKYIVKFKLLELYEELCCRFK